MGASREHALCQWLLAAERLDVAARAGQASLRQYGEHWLGLSGRQVEERLRVGRALRQLPHLDRALAEGELFFTVVRELTRVAVPDTEEAWGSWAMAEGRRGYREVERAVASREPGQAPHEPGDPDRGPHEYIKLKVSAEAKALFLDMKAKLGRDRSRGWPHRRQHLHL